MKRGSGAGKIVLIVFIVAIAIAGLLYFGYVFFQVEELEIVGNGKYTDVYIEGLADIQPNTHMTKLDEEAVKENIESKEAYLEVISVEKKLPKTLVIEVVERQPRVLIAHAGTFLLTDEKANVLEIFNAMPEDHYPVVKGFTITAATLGRQITTEDTFKITVLGEIVTAMDNKKMANLISEIDLSDVNSIRMTASNGLSIKFGQADHIADKMSSINSMLPRLEKENRTTGELNVSGVTPVYKKDESEMQGAGSTGQGQDADQAGDGQQDGTVEDGDTGDGQQDDTSSEEGQTPDEASAEE
ncbi:FtsQ-type POTRA domain-containing protein [Christensenellaceae bacterium OttesenSCG-928-K19]|nr:FtsQ-type POTRA domain-containing protein [Christensenellaceae bacterium OttesenSCG-928-K19]